MNGSLNILAYSIYLVIAIIITIYIGQQLHKHGYPFILEIFGDKSLAIAINNILLVGCYLINIGFTIYKISDWEMIVSYQQMIENLSLNIATILLVLGVMNIINIVTLTFLSRNKNLLTQ